MRRDKETVYALCAGRLPSLVPASASSDDQCLGDCKKVGESPCEGTRCCDQR